MLCGKHDYVVSIHIYIHTICVIQNEYIYLSLYCCDHYMYARYKKTIYTICKGGGDGILKESKYKY